MDGQVVGVAPVERVAPAVRDRWHHSELEAQGVAHLADRELEELIPMGVAPVVAQAAPPHQQSETHSKEHTQ